MQRRRKWHITRDLVLFVAGLAGIIYETVGVEVDRPYLLVLFAGMVGLPVFLYHDEKGKNGVRRRFPKITISAPEDEEE